MNTSNPTGLHVMTIPSPIGELSLYSDGSRLLRIGFPEQVTELAERREDPILVACARQLKEYFDGTRRHFDLPLGPRGTEFQLRVWEALTRHWKTYRGARCGGGQRAQPAAHRGPLPPGDRQRRFTHRFRRWAGGKNETVTTGR
jgi:hypothetical protein